MVNVMNRRKGKKLIVGIGIVVLIFLFLFIKMKYGTYGMHDFNSFFNQSKQEILEKKGEPISREALYGGCEDIVFDDIEYTFISEYPESARITDPDIRFGILRIGVGSSRREVMLAFGLKDRFIPESDDAYGFQNGIYRVGLYFDEDDRVYKITCGKGA